MARILLIFFISFHVFAFIVSAKENFESNSETRNIVEPKSSSISDPPTSGASMDQNPENESEFAGAPTIRRIGKHQHSTDNSIAGRGVIVGGLATAIFATIFAYIRVTRRKSRDSNQNTTWSSIAFVCSTIFSCEMKDPNAPTLVHYRNRLLYVVTWD